MKKNIFGLLFLFCFWSSQVYATDFGDVNVKGSLTVPDDAYDATSWNGSTAVPTKNAIRDKIESLTLSGSGAPTDATYITQTPNGSLSAEQALSGLATGLLKVTNGTGVLSSAGASDITGYAITGFSSGAGALAGTDTILQAINKLDGNIGTKATIDTTQKGITWNDGAQAVFEGSIHLLQGSLGTGDYDTDPDVWIIDLDSAAFPHGIYITKVYVDCNEADPTTELDADLKYCDAVSAGAFPGANATVIKALDTTTGNMSDTAVNTAVAAGKSLYITINADPVSDTTIFHVKIYYYKPES